MSSTAEIRELMEEQHHIMAARLAQAEENERREAEARQAAEDERWAAEARRIERKAVLAAEEEMERRAAEKAERKAKRRAEKKKKEEEETLGRVASRSKQKRVTEDAEDAEMDGDEACWNCRSRSIPCKRTR